MITNRSGSSRRRRAASAGTTSISACRRRHFRLTAWFGPNAPGREPGPPGEPHTDYGAIDLDEGGTAIPYAMEDPFIRAEYAETLKQAGVENRMEESWYAPGAKVRSAAE